MTCTTITAVTGHFDNELNLGFHKGLRGFCIVVAVSSASPVRSLLFVSCSRSLSQVVSHSTFFVTTAFMTMIQQDLGGKLRNFLAALALGACLLLRRSIDKDCLRKTPVANFVVLPENHEEEAMFRGPSRPTRTDLPPVATARWEIGKFAPSCARCDA